MKKLYRSNTNKVFAGVIGGIAEYFEIDPVILRLAWIAVFVFSGFVPAGLVYIIAIFVVPKKGHQ